jgi:hypothetical protein
MQDNLSVSVTADTSELRAQLALAQADLRAFGAETKNLANTIRAGGDAGGALRGQLEQKQKADQGYYQQKLAAAQGDEREHQRLQEEERVSYQEYLTKRQELDTKYFEARKAAEQKAAADSKAAWDKVLGSLTSSFDSAIKGFIQGTTTLQQAGGRVAPGASKATCQRAGSLREWGRRGSPGTVRLSCYQRRNEAEIAKRRTIKRRLQHGYRTIGLRPTIFERPVAEKPF